MHVAKTCQGPLDQRPQVETREGADVTGTVDPATGPAEGQTGSGTACGPGARQRPAHRVRQLRRKARAGLVHQPRLRRSGRGREGVLDRRLHDHHPGPPPGCRPAAHPAGAPSRGQGPRDRPDVARPTVHGRVRGRRLPRRGAAGRQGAAGGAGHLPGRHGRRHVEGPARRLPVLVQHPGPLVPQVLRGGGRHRHVAAGDVGPDHRRRQRERRQDRRPGQQVRGLRRVDQRARRGRRRPHPRGRRRRRGREDHDR